MTIKGDINEDKAYWVRFSDEWIRYADSAGYADVYLRDKWYMTTCLREEGSLRLFVVGEKTYEIGVFSEIVEVESPV